MIKCFNISDLVVPKGVVVVGEGGWIPLRYLVTSENDFRLSEAVTI